MSSEVVENSEVEAKGRMGKVIAVGAILFFVMVAASIGMMYVMAKNDAANRDLHPVVGQP